MENKEISEELLKTIRKAQIDEELGVVIYGYMAKREKNEDNKKLLEQMSEDESRHANVWHNITGEELRPNKLLIVFLKLLTIIMGFTFVVKIMQKGEKVSKRYYEEMQEVLPEVASILDDERRHETNLYGMLDEERLHYVGAMVLGLNDALVELTGSIAGVTFALANTRLVALTAIITGVSATLSMSASNYLAQKAENNSNALKSSIYTGAAYIVTVAIMVLPYLLLPSHMYIQAFFIMIFAVILIILFFNYYISVAKEEPFAKRFFGMAAISLSVAAISYLIGLLAKQLLGIEVA